ncbi:MAG: integration host factor subunit alpha [Hyphomicrobiaceae bacterium]
MGNKTLTRADLADAVVRRADIPRHEAQDIVEMVLGQISGTLERGEGVKLSSFGSFGVRKKNERIGRNPKTGEEKIITPRRVLIFRASNVMKERVNRLRTKGRDAAE